ncbi:MAG: hypothetical protein COA79_03970 [Planctomycetota bacterium]|nr:MAG: hypothetical protein COA79_03970 [Planctomycetota bacterium]
MRFVLPGMGATSEMYSDSWSMLNDAVFLDWPKINGEITFDNIASQLIAENQITSLDHIIGSSLGGIIAIEIAHQIKCNQVILIGSAINKSEINSLLLSLAPLSEITPLKFIQFIVGKSGGGLGQMFASVEADFIRSTCIELNQWNSPYCEEMNVKRIHGSRDHVIQCPDTADLIIEGGHLIAMTHSKACVDFIESICLKKE